jgi:hypothetical protein
MDLRPEQDGFLSEPGNSTVRSLVCLERMWISYSTQRIITLRRVAVVVFVLVLCLLGLRSGRVAETPWSSKSYSKEIFLFIL